MKYNSIGEQLIAKAKELDPSYKPDKFNDMSEALDVILNKSVGEDYSTEISTLNGRVDTLKNNVDVLLGYDIDNRITQLEDDTSAISGLDSRVNDLENTIIKEIPPLPSDANTKTYVLKAVNGVFT